MSISELLLLDLQTLITSQILVAEGSILGGGGLAYVMVRGCAIILGTFLAIPGFLGIIFW